MKDIRYAGFWIRFIASFFDTLFLALPIAVLIYFISGGEWFDFTQYQQNMQAAMAGNAQQALQNQRAINEMQRQQMLKQQQREKDQRTYDILKEVHKFFCIRDTGRDCP